MKKIIRFITVIICVMALGVNANAAAIVFRGNLGAENAGKSIVFAMYGENADINAISVSDILYINQIQADGQGTWKFKLPLDEVNNWQAQQFRTNAIDYALEEPRDTVYLSENGNDANDGSQASPVQSLRQALEILDSGTINLSGTVSVPADFVWPRNGQSVTISGTDAAAALDIRALDDFEIGSDAVFKNLTFICADDGVSGSAINSKNAIYANGYHVIFEESVKTSTVVSLYGGSCRGEVESTSLEVYGGTYKRIYGGGNKYNVAGNSVLTVGGAVNSAYSVKDSDSTYVLTTCISGGSSATVKGNTTLTLKGNAKFAYVRGGSAGTAAPDAGSKSTINILGGSYMNVYGCAQNAAGYVQEVEIHMSGGSAEAIFGGAEGQTVNANTAIYITGGTVTRRVYGGSYNGWSLSWSGTTYVNGTTSVIVGKNANLAFNYDINRGLFAGSRREENSADEISALIFLNDSYAGFSSKIGDVSGWGSDFKSHHDHIIKVSSGGTVKAAGSDGGSYRMQIIPDAGYKALADGVQITDEYYSIPTDAEIVNVTFEQTVPAATDSIVNAEITEQGNGTKFAVDYTFSDSTAKAIIVLAVYEGSGNDSKLIDVKTQEATTPGGEADEIVLDYELIQGKAYSVKVMLWSNLDGLKPLCADFGLSINGG